MEYRREIDGLRALAVLSVILFHADFQTFNGGFVGVDVFFVISGYLITTIILRDLKNQRFSLADFYERRARRIFPALILIMLVSSVFAWVYFWPKDIKDFSQSLVAVSFFLSNVLFWSESGYFETNSELKPLLHTWSLAIEEQFYLIFPIVFILIYKSRRRIFLGLLILVFIFSLLSAEFTAIRNPSAAFYLLPFRIWELLVGVFVALYLEDNNRKELGGKVSDIVGWIGLGLIFVAVFTFDSKTIFPGFSALVPTLGAALFILFARKDTVVGSVVGNKILVSIGLISYSAYLWHQPLFSFYRYSSEFKSDSSIYLSLVTLSFLLAYLTWRYVEKPFREKNFIERKLFLKFTSCFLGLFIALGAGGHHFFDIYEKLWISNLPEMQQKFYRAVSLAKNDPGDRVVNGTQCRFHSYVLDSLVSEKLKNCFNLYGSGVLIIGDSHALDLYGATTSKFSQEFLVGITTNGCRPDTKYRNCQYDILYNFLKLNTEMFDHIIYEQAGFYMFLDENGEETTRRSFSKLASDSSKFPVVINMSYINSTLNYLNSISSLVPVTWFLPRIEHHFPFNEILKHGCDNQFSLPVSLKDNFKNLEGTILSLVTDLSNSRFKAISQNSTFQFDFSKDLVTCEQVFWSDGDHFSASGERRFGSRLPDDFLVF